MPAGPLMKEHRLIERAIALMKTEIGRIRRDNRVHPAFLDATLDFIKTYADRCHHGKEEDILFRELRNKKISPNHTGIMNDLIKEHAFARDTVKKIADAEKNYVGGDRQVLGIILSGMESLVDFYPKHIEKEDKHFFLPCMEYFTDGEKEAMLKEMTDFDRGMIHAMYEGVVSRLESGR